MGRRKHPQSRRPRNPGRRFVSRITDFEAIGHVTGNRGFFDNARLAFACEISSASPQEVRRTEARTPSFRSILGVQAALRTCRDLCTVRLYVPRSQSSRFTGPPSAPRRALSEPGRPLKVHGSLGNRPHASELRLASKGQRTRHQRVDTEEGRRGGGWKQQATEGGGYDEASWLPGSPQIRLIATSPKRRMEAPWLLTHEWPTQGFES